MAFDRFDQMEMKMSEKNVNAKKSSNGWAAFLTDPNVARGYADAIIGDFWPKEPAENYEWGRYLGAEVLSIEGSKAPWTIPRMKRITKEWQNRIDACVEFRKLVRRHFEK